MSQNAPNLFYHIGTLKMLRLSMDFIYVCTFNYKIMSDLRIILFIN